MDVGLILQIAALLLALRSLAQKIKQDKIRTQIIERINELKKAIAEYAEMHFELRDWKIIHGKLNSLFANFENIGEFKALLEKEEESITETEIDNADKKWRSYQRLHLTPFSQTQEDIKYIEKTVTLTTMDYRSGTAKKTQIFKAVQEFQGKITDGFDRIKRGAPRSYLHDFLGQFRDFLNDALMDADGKIRRLAGELAELSIKLKTELEKKEPAK